ncbi:MAG: CDP-alcohol phosphatidyltransferase family protein [Gemmatimonadetes bacterium]|nr:CDP-alcohol phosphatidyltransferase family protein [Gemmatimonadota bacterium]
MKLQPSALRDQGTRLLQPVMDLFVRTGLTPNAATTIGFVVTAGAGISYFFGHLQLGGLLVLLGGFFDIVDGYIARRRSMSTTFGSFYDSTLDRVSEVVVLMGVMSLYVGDRPTLGVWWMVYVVAAAIAGSLLVSYTRARAEGLGIDCRVGLMQRAERILLLGIATLFFGSWRNGVVLTWVMLAMAALTNLTALYRVYWVYKYTNAAPAARPRAKTPV